VSVVARHEVTSWDLPEDYANPSDGGLGRLPCRADFFLHGRSHDRLRVSALPSRAERSPTDNALDGIAILSHSKTAHRPTLPNLTGGTSVSIVRIGLAETKHFADGYDAIFGRKKAAQGKKRQAAVKNRLAKRKKKPAKKK
jgi:hypothetical protein